MKNIQAQHETNGLTEKGEKEAFRTLQSTSDNSSNVDTKAIGEIGGITNSFISATKYAAANAGTTEEKERLLRQAQEALNDAREDIRKINMRSHKTQRGIATIAGKALLAAAAGAIAGGIWLLSKR